MSKGMTTGLEVCMCTATEPHPRPFPSTLYPSPPHPHTICFHPHSFTLVIVDTEHNIHHHHHREHAPDWSVAVSTSCFHRPRSWASRQAEFRPWLSGWRSASVVRSQVRRGRPGRRLQSLGNPRIDVYRALDVSCESPIRATCVILVQLN